MREGDTVTRNELGLWVVTRPTNQVQISLALGSRITRHLELHHLHQQAQTIIQINQS